MHMRIGATLTLVEDGELWVRDDEFGEALGDRLQHLIDGVHDAAGGVVVDGDHPGAVDGGGGWQGAVGVDA